MTMSAEKYKRLTEITSYCEWMSQLPPELHSIPLYDLAIPGSHDCMSYDLDINSPIAEPERLKKFSKIYCVRKIVRTWATTQEDTITEQLDAGVRYFDLRIARKPNDTDPKRLYFYHGLYTRTDVETVLKLINDWAARNPKEVLILAFSHFKGFDKKNEKDLHTHLINFIKTLFGAKLVISPRTPKKDIPTLKKCWDQGRNVIVSYEYPPLKQPQIWRKITYYYGNSMDTTKIKSKLCQELKKKPSHSFFVCGLNLTLPANVGILKYILRLCDNFPNVVHRSLPRLLQWVKDQDCKIQMNIVASDVVTRDDFVATVVRLNANR